MTDCSDLDSSPEYYTEEMSPNQRYWKYLSDKGLLAPRKKFGAGDPSKSGNLLGKLLEAADSPCPKRTNRLNRIDGSADDSDEVVSPSLKRRKIADEKQELLDQKNPLKISHDFAPSEYKDDPALPPTHYLQGPDYEYFKMTIFPAMCTTERQIELIIRYIQAIKYSPRYECREYEYRYDLVRSIFY